MKIVKTCCCTLAVTLCVAASSAWAAAEQKVDNGTNQSPVRFSVVQWNIGHFALGKNSQTAIAPEESSARSAAYRAMIAQLKPDFLGVSEFDPIFD